MTLEKNREIEAISQFVQTYPESTVSRRITREIFGAHPAVDEPSVQMIRQKLEASDDTTIDNYFTLIR